MNSGPSFNEGGEDFSTTMLYYMKSSYNTYYTCKM